MTLPNRMFFAADIPGGEPEPESSFRPEAPPTSSEGEAQSPDERDAPPPPAPPELDQGIVSYIKGVKLLTAIPPEVAARHLNGHDARFRARRTDFAAWCGAFDAALAKENAT